MHVLQTCGRRVQTQASCIKIIISRGVTNVSPAEARRVQLEEQILHRRQTVLPEDLPCR